MVGRGGALGSWGAFLAEGRSAKALCGRGANELEWWAVSDRSVGQMVYVRPGSRCDDRTLS